MDDIGTLKDIELLRKIGTDSHHSKFSRDVPQKATRGYAKNPANVVANHSVSESEKGSKTSLGRMEKSWNLHAKFKSIHALADTKQPSANPLLTVGDDPSQMEGRRGGRRGGEREGGGHPFERSELVHVQDVDALVS